MHSAFCIAAKNGGVIRGQARVFRKVRAQHVVPAIFVLKGAPILEFKKIIRRNSDADRPRSPHAVRAADLSVRR
jgi:hypothetical protein